MIKAINYVFCCIVLFTAAFTSCQKEIRSEPSSGNDLKGGEDVYVFLTLWKHGTMKAESYLLTIRIKKKDNFNIYHELWSLGYFVRIQEIAGLVKERVSADEIHSELESAVNDDVLAKGVSDDRSKINAFRKLLSLSFRKQEFLLRFLKEERIGYYYTNCVKALENANIVNCEVENIKYLETNEYTELVEVSECFLGKAVPQTRSQKEEKILKVLID